MGYTQPQPAIPMVSGNWWAMVLRRIAAVLFGLAVLLWPGMTLHVLLVVFAVYALVVGLFAIVAVLFASWPIALGQGLRALADVAEYVQRQQSGLG